MCSSAEAARTRARMHKAVKLAGVLYEVYVDSEKFTEETWKLAATACKVGMPSLLTREMTILLMSMRMGWEHTPEQCAVIVKAEL